MATDACRSSENVKIADAVLLRFIYATRICTTEYTQCFFYGCEGSSNSNVKPTYRGNE